MHHYRKILYLCLTETDSSAIIVFVHSRIHSETKALVRDAISAELDKDLPNSYDVDSFNAKTDLLLNHFMDMSVQGYGWIA